MSDLICAKVRLTAGTFVCPRPGTRSFRITRGVTLTNRSRTLVSSAVPSNQLSLSKRGGPVTCRSVRLSGRWLAVRLLTRAVRSTSGRAKTNFLSTTTRAVIHSHALACAGLAGHSDLVLTGSDGFGGRLPVPGRVGETRCKLEIRVERFI